jgi:hypothetical protein
MHHDQYGGIDTPAVAWDDDDSPITPLAALPGQVDRRAPSPAEQDWRTLAAHVMEGAIRDLCHRDPAVRAAAAQWWGDPHLPVTINLADACGALGLRPGRTGKMALRWAGLL